ncbi:MAG: holo-ACP synthase [Trueperaceae bacterium]
MIRAIGLDLVELSRIRGVLKRHPERFLTRHFTPDEVRYCRSQRDPVPSLAARFAAKEAFQKCWPEPHGWRDVWVVRDSDAPHLAFARTLAQAVFEQGLVAHLSLSHSRDHAAAVVVLERQPTES